MTEVSINIILYTVIIPKSPVVDILSLDVVDAALDTP